MKRMLIAIAVMDMVMIGLMIAMVIRANAEYVTAPEGLRIRADPGTSAEVLEVLPFRAEVSGEIEAGWMRLEGRDGYVCADYVSVEDPLAGAQLLGEWRITAYAETGYLCANGRYPTVGYTIACNSLDFGTEVYIDGIGFRTVEDRGPTWLGSEWCDLYLGDYWSCVAWGNQYRKVWRIKNDQTDND